jgi:hypothetical protein
MERSQSPVIELSAGEVRRVIFASSLGTVFEWYDFYLYGSLAAIISKQFFSGVSNPTTAFIFALLAFAAGFAVRPFGAIFFGRLGDLVGRKYTFLITILIMGMSTSIVGLLPSYAKSASSHRCSSSPCASCKVSRSAESTAVPRRMWRSMHQWESEAHTLVDSNDGDARALPLAPRHSWLPHAARQRGVRVVGLAHPVSRVAGAARCIGVDSPQAERVAAVPADEA